MIDACAAPPAGWNKTLYRAPHTQHCHACRSPNVLWCLRLHAAADVALAPEVVKPLGQAAQLGFGTDALPPADQVPTRQPLQAGPPVPRPHTVTEGSRRGKVHWLNEEACMIATTFIHHKLHQGAL